MPDQVDRLILITQGEQEVKRLQAALDAEKQALDAAVAAANAASAGSARYSAAVQASGARVAALSGQLRAAQAAQASAGSATGNLSNAIQTLSFTTNDAEQFSVSYAAGLRSISNNIPGLINSLLTLRNAGFAGITTALAGPAGIILGFTALSTLVPLVSAHWGDLTDLWIGGETSTEAERMEKLAKATKLTADETERLVKFNREQAVGKRLEEARPEAVEKASKAAEKAVSELDEGGGAVALRDALVRGRNPGGLAGRISEEDRVKIQKLRDNLETGSPAAGDTRAKRQQTLKQAEREAEQHARDAERERAAGDIKTAVADPERLQGLLNELRNTGNAAYADELEARIYLESDVYKEKEQANEEDTRKSQQLLAKRKAARNRDQKKAAQEVEQSDEESAKALAAGPLGSQLLTGLDVQAGDVQAALKESGANATPADAAAVQAKLKEEIQGQIQERALKEGISPDLAANRIFQERAKKDEDRARAERDRAKAEQDRLAKEQLDAIEKKTPFAPDLARAEAGAALAQGASVGQARTLIEQLLLKAFPGAGLAAGKLADDAVKDAQKDAFAEAIKDKKSQVFGDTASLLSAVQTAIGGKGDYDRQQVEHLKDIRDVLRQQAQRNQAQSGGFRFRRA